MALYITDSCIGCGSCLRICPVDAVSGESMKKHVIDRTRCIECSACGRVCPTGSITDIFGKVIQRIPRSAWEVPRITRQKCTSCGICVEVCPAQVLEMELHDGVLTAVVKHPSSCVSCEWCIDNCMFSAIDMEKKDAEAGSAREESQG